MAPTATRGPDLGPPPGVIARAEWTKAGPDMGNINPMNGINRITIHHDGMPPAILSC